MATLGIWHGYLLGATGSNVYTANVARSWSEAGHDVVLMCQDRDFDAYPFVNEAVRLDASGAVASLTPLHPQPPGSGRCVAVAFELGGLLPVYVLDKYPGFERVELFVDLPDHELQEYVEANRVGLRAVLAGHDLAGVVVNHAVMGPTALRPVLEEAGVPYSVKIHGSDLEYAVAQDERFVAFAREGLAGARVVVVGSDHIRRRTFDLLGEDCAPGGVEDVPPGVDMDRFALLERDELRPVWRGLVEMVTEQGLEGDGRDARHAVHLEAELDYAATNRGELPARLARIGSSYDQRALDVQAGEALAEIDPADGALITVVSKLIHQKGVQLAIAAMPLVIQRHPDMRVVVAGFGKIREPLEALTSALVRGDRQLLEQVVSHGGEYSGEQPGPWRFLPDFFAGLEARGELDSYFAAAANLRRHMVFIGPVTHAHLPALWGCARVNVVPSIFPEAFGMVAAEAASCGAVPVVGLHTGLGEVGGEIAQRLPEQTRPLVGFRLDDPDPVLRIADVLSDWCALPDELARECAVSARLAVAELWSWDSIGARLAAPFL